MSPSSFWQRSLFLSLPLLYSFSGSAFATYTKISNTGKALPFSAELGYQADDWACTYDSETKLIWEVKTNDNRLRDKYWLYTWFKSTTDNTVNPNSSGLCRTVGRCDTEKYIQDINTQNLCGAADWRLPTNAELQSIVLCTTGVSDTGGCNQDSVMPNINQDFFPNTLEFRYWNSGLTTADITKARYVSFMNSTDFFGNKSDEYAVRLVRSGKSFDPSTAESVNALFDTSTQVLTIEDVQVQNQHYRVALQSSENDLFTLKTAEILTGQVQSEPAQYDLAAATLSIPKAQVGTQFFTFIFKNNGSFVFHLESKQELK